MNGQCLLSQNNNDESTSIAPKQTLIVRNDACSVDLII